jgi:hypothetical protein
MSSNYNVLYIAYVFRGKVPFNPIEAELLEHRRNVLHPELVRAFTSSGQLLVDYITPQGALVERHPQDFVGVRTCGSVATGRKRKAVPRRA